MNSTILLYRKTKVCHIQFLQLHGYVILGRSSYKFLIVCVFRSVQYVPEVYTVDRSLQAKSKKVIKL